MSGQKMYDFSKFARDANYEVVSTKSANGTVVYWIIDVKGNYQGPFKTLSEARQSAQTKGQDIAKELEAGDMTTDPPVSQAQRGAMFAAKAGKSNLGIPQKVGAEFAKADPGGKLPEKKQ